MIRSLFHKQHYFFISRTLVYKMLKIFERVVICLLFLSASNTYSEEYLLESKITTGAGYNSNPYLSVQPREVTSIIITPSISGIVKESNWQTKFDAAVSSYTDDDPEKDSDNIGKRFSLSGRYGAERNIFSLNLGYDLTSNLSSLSEDFGTVARRINRKNQSITPGYTRLLTERLVFSLSYTKTKVDFEYAENTNLMPYNLETGSSSLSYDLTEEDKLTFSLQVTDYQSENNQVTYQTFVSQLGLAHKFSETWSTDLSIGVSRQKSTNIIDFFGQTGVRQQEIDVKNRGLVMNATVEKRLELGSLNTSLSRSDSSNSFGGLNQVDSFKLDYETKFSSLWHYSIGTRFDRIESITSNASISDRDYLYFNTAVSYNISLNWSTNISYSYAQRKLKGDLSSNDEPHSNRVFMGLTYNFPTLSTF